MPFLWQKRKYNVVSDDGMDWLGHARGRVFEEEYDEGCNCPLGKIEHEKQEIKKMCENCKYYTGLYCTNKNVIDSVSKIFNMPNKLEIKDSTKSCDSWELNIDFFKQLVK